jgi:hypothetical protein
MSIVTLLATLRTAMLVFIPPDKAFRDTTLVNLHDIQGYSNLLINSFNMSNQDAIKTLSLINSLTQATCLSDASYLNDNHYVELIYSKRGADLFDLLARNRDYTSECKFVVNPDHPPALSIRHVRTSVTYFTCGCVKSDYDFVVKCDEHGGFMWHLLKWFV